MKKLLVHSVWLLLLAPGVAFAQLSPGYSPDLSGLPSPAAHSPSGNWQPMSLQNSAFGTLNTGFQPAGSNIPQQTLGPFCEEGLCSYTPLEPFNWYDARPGAYGSLAQYLNAAFRVILTLGAMLAVVMIVFAGISYMISESGIKTSMAKDRLKSALTGLALLIGAWLIVAAVNPNLLSLSTLMNVFPPRTAPLNSGQENSGILQAFPNQAEINTEIKKCEGGRGVVRVNPTDNKFTCFPTI